MRNGLWFATCRLNFFLEDAETTCVLIETTSGGSGACKPLFRQLNSRSRRYVGKPAHQAGVAGRRRSRHDVRMALAPLCLTPGPDEAVFFPAEP